MLLAKIPIEKVYNCSACGFCRSGCPVYKQVGYEPYLVPFVRILESTKLNDWIDEMGSYVSLSPDLLNCLYLCAGCGYCKESCPYELDFPTVIRSTRAELIRRGIEPLPPLKKAAKILIDTYNPFGKPSVERRDWIQKGTKVPERGETVYFVGCYTSYRFPEIAKATLNVFNKAGLDLAVLRDERCCGALNFWDGQRSLSENLARQNFKTLKAAGARRIITTCAGCYRTLKLDYPEVLGSFDFEVLHASEVLSKLVDEDRIRFGSKLKGTITYHDPCHLGRHSNVYEEPRRILDNIPGVRLVEMTESREKAICCGGGGIQSVSPYLSSSIARSRVRDALETGANTLVTACPLCVNNLSLGVDMEDAPLKVYDIVTLVSELMV